MHSNDFHTRIGCRLGLMWAIICLLVVPLSGCGGEITPTPEPVTIVSAHFGSDADYYETLVQEFNESYPYITVKLVGPDADADAVDVFVNSPFALSYLQEQGSILSVRPFIEQDASFDLSDFYPGTVELFTSEGEMWAVPGGVNVMVMFYNRDLLDQYGVPHPKIGWTWDDFLSMALALRDPEASVFGYAPIDPFLDSLAFIYQHGGRIFDDVQNPTRTTFDDPLTIEALEWYVKLIHEHDVAPSVGQVYDRAFGGSMESGVYLGKVGMWSGWLSERGGGEGVEATWPAEWKMRWGVVPLPRDAQPATLAFVGGYFISSDTQHPDACWQWISFLSEQMPTDAVPVRKSLAESDAYEQQVGSNVATAARASMEDAVLFSPRLAEFGGAMQIFGMTLDAIINQRSTPEEAMLQAQRQAEE